MEEKELILIVEDDPANNEMLRQVLEDEKFKVKQTFNGKEAFEFLKTKKPDLILLDLMLPDIDGFTICQELKSKRDTNLIPIIMLTALTEHKNMIKGFKVGANKYITKPFEIFNLLIEIRNLLEWKKTVTENKGKFYEAVSFEMRSELKYLDELNQMISNFLRRTSLSETEIEELKLGIYEIGVNAMEWGNKFDEDLLVKVKYEITESQITITIEDEGTGFNFKKFLDGKYKGIAQQDSRLDEGKRLGGFGILITKKYFDEIKYNDLGNKTILIKKLNK